MRAPMWMLPKLKQMLRYIDTRIISFFATRFEVNRPEAHVATVWMFCGCICGQGHYITLLDCLVSVSHTSSIVTLTFLE